MGALLGDLLPYIFSRADALKRQLADAAQNPMGLLGQRGGQLEDATKNVAGGGLLAPAGSPERQQWSDAVDQMGPGLLGMTVYHGSPHVFDKFDLSKIGTGEGAQAYGHGLYFADNQKVAQEYKNKLGPLFHTVDGNPVEGEAAQWAAIGLSQYKSPAAAKAQIQRLAAAGYPSKDAATQFVKDGLAAVDNFAGRNVASGVAGNVYKVDIPDEAISNMLHWDKPLSDQPKVVQQALGMGDPQAGLAAQNPGMTGAQVYNELSLAMGGRPQATKFLQSQGIPGIRYLDAGSRASGGTYNTVLFDDSLAKILGRE